MILVGQYDSPPTRRIAISLLVLGIPFEHDARSIFGDFDALRTINPLGRIPSLVRDDGTALIDSAAILDWIDREVGPERALMPVSGHERTSAMQIVALALGAVEKIGAAAYERLMRPCQYRWPDWIARCRTQGEGALPALDRLSWSEKLDQAQITTWWATCARSIPNSSRSGNIRRLMRWRTGANLWRSSRLRASKVTPFHSGRHSFLPSCARKSPDLCGRDSMAGSHHQESSGPGNTNGPAALHFHPVCSDTTLIVDGRISANRPIICLRECHRVAGACAKQCRIKRLADMLADSAGFVRRSADPALSLDQGRRERHRFEQPRIREKPVPYTRQIRLAAHAPQHKPPPLVPPTHSSKLPGETPFPRSPWLTSRFSTTSKTASSPSP
jgi:glutathione S-transferase